MKKKMQEAWVKRFVGYFGEFHCMDEWRAGKITFFEMRRQLRNMVDGMTTEALSCESQLLED